MVRWLRYLRIAFSVTCGIACVLFLVLWVRSYSLVDDVSWGSATNGPGYKVITLDGELLAHQWQTRRGAVARGWNHGSIPAEGEDGLWERGPSKCLCFSFGLADGKPYMVVSPLWTLIGTVAAVATVPWLRWRFSLRTLLIATTLIAVVLGAIAYAAS